MFKRRASDLGFAPRANIDGRGDQADALLVGQDLGHAAAYRRHERMRRAQVDADGKPPLVRCRRLTGFRNLQ